MSEENPNTDLSSQSEYLEPEAYEPPSKTDAMVGVITEPGETFETIKRSPGNYWLIAIIISSLLGLVSTFLFFTDAELVDKMKSTQMNKVQESMKEKVQSGELTQEKADDAMQKAESMISISMKIGGYILAFVWPFVVLFVLGLVYFIILKTMKISASFTSILNVIGLSYIVRAIGGLISVLILMFIGDIKTISLGFPFSPESIGKISFSILSQFEIFSIWFYILAAVGLTKISGLNIGKTIAIVFATWIASILLVALVFSRFM